MRDTNYACARVGCDLKSTPPQASSPAMTQLDAVEKQDNVDSVEIWVFIQCVRSS